MVTNQVSTVREIYIQNTTNQSFLDVHYSLKSMGITNNAFFLVLFDPGLNGVNPRDPRLNLMMKQRIFRECQFNYWYFIRECILIPVSGGTIPYKLHRGNLALNFCLMLNFNVFAEFPRQHGKTIAVVCRLLWEFLFGTNNSEIAFFNKKHEDSKDNLQRMKNIRENLPEYLRFDSKYSKAGDKKLKPKNTAETLENPINGNKIRTMPAARTPSNANSLGRGCTLPRIWYDEYAFIIHNKMIYMSATPAYKTASMKAKEFCKPYGMIITTTPGILTTEEGKEAFETKDLATPFNEHWYDSSKQQLDELLAKNTSSPFVYIKFNYQELGSTETWLAEIIKEMKKDWVAIRREVLLEWAEVSDRCPFSQQDIATVSKFVRDPIYTIPVCNYYQFNIYEQLKPGVVPIIGVDVSGGLQRDSSTICVIDSTTTRVVADFNCNYISPHDLARVVYEIVSKYMQNAIVNVERNGGFGASVLKDLIKTDIKKNLYYEIKDQVIEERVNGTNISKYKEKRRVFGFNNTGSSRETLMEILRQRMLYHKDKFISPRILQELKTLEVKPSGRIDHSTNGHDDQIFSYLLAMYVWCYGENLAQIWNVNRGSIKTDEDLTECITQVGGVGGYADITQELISIENENDQAHVSQQLSAIKDNTMSHNQWKNKVAQEDQSALMELLKNNEAARNAYASKYNKPIEEVNMEYKNNNYTISNKVFEDFYK